MTLDSGRYLGEELAARRTRQLLLTKTRHPSNGVVPRHEHERPYVCFVLKGGFAEFSELREERCGPGTAVFHPGPDGHSDTFSPEGALCLNVQWSSDAGPAGAAYSHCGPLSWGAGQILRELQAQDPDALALDALGQELLALASKVRRKLDLPKARQAHAILRERYSEKLTLASISGELLVHPMHLARCYRQASGMSVGEALRLIRVRRAAQLVLGDKEGLAEIAVACGFYDQSHLTNVFRRITGFSPGEYRDLFLRA